MRILYVGLLDLGETCRHRMIALQDLGHEAVGINSSPPGLWWERQLQLPMKVLNRIGFPVDLPKINQQILKSIKKESFDILWVDKGLTIYPKTLIAIKKQQPECRLVFYSPDDMMNPRNQSRYYLASLPIYDLHVTTKSYNVAELKKLGVQDVIFIDKAYDPHTHLPIILSPEEKAKWSADVGFIGGFEEDRFQKMLTLAKAGIEVTIRGPGWSHLRNIHHNLIIESGWVIDVNYAKIICATKINLNFLRKVNRDLQTARSIEIPATGSFMLAERTGEHLSLFVEGKEAEFFSNEEELIAKVRYYLDHERERKHIAAAGRKRCLQSGYSNKERLTYVFEYLYRNS